MNELGDYKDIVDEFSDCVTQRNINARQNTVEVFLEDLEREKLMVVVELETIELAWGLISALLKECRFNGVLYIAYYGEIEQDQDEEMIRTVTPAVPCDIEEPFPYIREVCSGGDVECTLQYIRWKDEFNTEFLKSFTCVFLCTPSDELVEKVSDWPVDILAYKIPDDREALPEPDKDAGREPEDLGNGSYFQIPELDSKGIVVQVTQMYLEQMFMYTKDVPVNLLSPKGAAIKISGKELDNYAELEEKMKVVVDHFRLLQEKAETLFPPPPADAGPMILCPVVFGPYYDVIEELYAYLVLLAFHAFNTDKGAIVPIFTRSQTAHAIKYLADKITSIEHIVTLFDPENDEGFDAELNDKFPRFLRFQMLLTSHITTGLTGDQVSLRDAKVRNKLCYCTLDEINNYLKTKFELGCDKVYFYIAGDYGVHADEEMLQWPSAYVKDVMYRLATLTLPDTKTLAAASFRPFLPSWAVNGQHYLDQITAIEAVLVLKRYQALCAIPIVDNEADDEFILKWIDEAYKWIMEAATPKSKTNEFFEHRAATLMSVYGNTFWNLVIAYKDFKKYLKTNPDYPGEDELYPPEDALQKNASPYEVFRSQFTASIRAKGLVDFAAYPQFTSLAEVLTALTGSAVVSVSSPESFSFLQSGNGGPIWGMLLDDCSIRFADDRFTGSIMIDGGVAAEYMSTDINVYAEGLFCPPGLPWLSLKRVGLDLYVPYGGLPVAELVGTLSEADVFLRIGMDWGSGVFVMRGALGTVLTGLDAISALCGGVDFTAQLPEPLRVLGGIGLRGFTADYDSVNNKVLRFSLELGMEQGWTVLDKPLITVNPRIVLDIYNPGDFANRSFYVTLYGDCVIGEGNGILRLSGSYAPLILGMELLPGQEFSVKTLLNDCGIENSPCDLVIDTLKITAAPSANAYRIAVSVRDVLDLDKFKITSLGLFLRHNNAGLTAAFAGSIKVCSVGARARVAYSTEGGWLLSAGVSFGESGVDAKRMIAEFDSNRLALANDDSPNPVLANADVSYAVTTGFWSVAASVDGWEIPFLKDSRTSAFFGIGEDSNGFFCTLGGELVWHNIDLAIRYSYQAEHHYFELIWNKLSGRVVSTPAGSCAELHISGVTLGEMVETMVGWVRGASFGLVEPWGSILNGISLNAGLTYNFTTGAVSLTVQCSEIDVGFAKIRGVRLTYGSGADGRRGALIALEGDFSLMLGGQAPAWDAARPETTPAPNGKGNAYFDLRLLAIGQKVDFFDGQVPATVQDAVTLIRKLDPDMRPARSDLVDWVIAADFGVLRQGDGNYLFDAQMLFYDPQLYALRISAGGGPLKGLVFDILYLRLSDTLGVFRGVITLPDRIRRIDIGAYTLILPIFAADIYTDGSFRLDFGFPTGGNFSRSLSFQGMAGPIPIAGAAGFYIGRFLGAAAGSLVPATTKGIFAPVTAFGFGIQFGIGKSVNAGVLKAGFSFSMIAILEGVFARFSPFDGGDSTDYYKVSGLIGVEGGLYGMIDFAIISASVSARIQLSAAFVFEAYRAAEIMVSVKISLTASLQINLFLFSITINFKFSANVSASFIIGKNTLAPWDGPNRLFAAPVRAIEAAVLHFDHLRAPASPYFCAAQISLPLSVTDRPTKAVTAALLLTVEEQSFAELVGRVLCWLVAAAGSAPATLDEAMRFCPDEAEIDSILAALTGDDALPMTAVTSFLSRFVHVRVSSVEALNAANADIAGVFFPFPPDTRVDGKALSERGVLTAAMLDAMKAAFGKLALEMKTREKNVKGFRRKTGEQSAAAWLFGDYFVFLARQTLERARPFADGKASLAKILTELDIAGIGGMLSRYNLHGLRVPLPNGTEQPALALAGLLRTGVSGTDSVAVASGDGWLEIPEKFALTPDPACYTMLEGFLKTERFSPRYTVQPEKPSSIPVKLSFPPSYRLGAHEVWNVPAALPKGGEQYTLHFDSGAAGMTACVVPLELQRTKAPGVYTIRGDTSESANALADVVQKRHPIDSVRLFLSRDGSYSPIDADRIVAARTDLSTETHPPLMQRDGFGAEHTRLAALLFEALVTNNNGYLLIVPGAVDDSMFDAHGNASFRLLFLFANSVGLTERAVTAVASTVPGTPIAVAETSCYQFAATAGSTSLVNAEFALLRTFPADESVEAFVESNYSLLRYAVRAEEGGFPASAYSAPVSFTGDGLFRFALPADTLLGDGDYGAVGHTLKVDCQWLDVFGNVYGKSFELSVLCGYTDSLTAATAWPYVRFAYGIVDTNLLLYAVPADRDSVPAGKLDDVCDEYAYIVRQLRDKNGVTTRFECSTLGVDKSVPLAEWAEKLLAYWEHGGNPPELKEHFTIRCSVTKGESLALHKISASLRIKRHGAAQKNFENVPRVTDTCSELPVPEDCRAFAAAYEAAVGGVRVLKNGSELYEIPAIEPKITLGADARVFAPPPFFGRLYSGSTGAYQYTPGLGLTQTAAAYTGADGNRMAVNALALLDQVFSVDIAAAAALCGYDFARLESAKKRLAKVLSGRLTLVIPGKGNAPSMAVQEAFYRRMLSKLSNYYGLRAVIALDADVGVSRENARLYGEVHGETAALGLELTSAKLDLRAGAGELVISVAGQETVYDKDGAALSSTEIALCYDVSHIEDAVTEVIDGYVSSVWLGGASSGTIAALTAPEKIILPLPAQYFPEAPLFTGHAFVMDKDFTARYRLSYAKARHLPQVADHITVRYNPGERVLAGAHPLMNALAGFATAGEDILADLHTIAGNILREYSQAAVYEKELGVAMDAMLTLASELETALTTTPSLRGARDAEETLHFQVSEGVWDGKYTLSVSGDDILPILEGCIAESIGGNVYVFEKEDSSYLTPAEGQSIRERTFLLPPRKILSARSATAEMFSQVGAKLPSAFLMRTDDIAAGSVILADFTAKGAIDLNERYPCKDITAAIEALLVEIGGELPISAECRRVDANGAEFPLFMQLPSRDNAGKLSAAWCDKMNAWLDTVPEALRNGKTFAFRIDLRFGDVLKVPNVIARTKAERS